METQLDIVIAATCA